MADRVPGESIPCDFSQQWDTSKEECRFDLYSISKEHLNNIKFNGHTVANIQIYNDNGDHEILEISDNSVAV